MSIERIIKIVFILLLLSQIPILIFLWFESQKVKDAQHLIENRSTLSQKYCYNLKSGYFTEVPYIEDIAYCKELLQLYQLDEYTSKSPKFVKGWLKVTYHPFYIIDYKCDSQLIHFILVGPPPCNNYIMGYVDSRSVHDTINNDVLIYMKNSDDVTINSPHLKKLRKQYKIKPVGVECND